jgi:ABC-type transporter Mla subunit MlaD
MRGRSPLGSLAASPTMVGAVTTLIVIVAVFLAYNANNGLPFVPVYRVSVEVPNSARLTNNNEVRIGGHRVGVVETIEPIQLEESQQTAQGGDTGTGGDDVVEETATDTGTIGARLNLKLDKTAQPLPEDSIFRVRYRSSFGLKYLEIVRGTGDPAPEGYTFDGTDDGEICDLPIDTDTFASTREESGDNGCFQTQTEFDDINNTFDEPTRRNSRTNLEGFGSGFAGRGTSLNDAIQSLEPLFHGLRPVSRMLIEPSTRFENFFPELADAARIVAPVSEVQSEFFTFAQIAFAAISSDPVALQDTIEEGPRTLGTGIFTLPRQRPFLRDFTTLTRALRPGVADLRITLPTLNSAIDVGTPVLKRTVGMNKRLKGALKELLQLVEQPSTLTSLQRLRETFETADPLARFVVPSQTVCNHFNYWFTFLPEGLSDRDNSGYFFRQALAAFPRGDITIQLPPPLDILGPITAPGDVQTPLAGYSGIQANARAGAAAGGDEGVYKPYELPTLYAQAYAPHGEDGDEDCQSGQNGYLLGSGVAGAPGSLRVGSDPGIGQGNENPAIGVSDLPGSRGPTTLFWNSDSTRELRDTRVPNRAPESWEGL